MSASIKLEKIIDSAWFQNFIIGVIIFNGIVLGLATYPLSTDTIAFLDKLDQVCLAIFVAEIAAKLYVQKNLFFRDNWNNFDFIIVAVALLPATGELSILRAFRIFRVLRLVTRIPSIKRVVRGMLHAIPGVSSVAGLLLIVFYIASVISTSVFGHAFPEWFGSIEASMFTLFQVMTLESWSMGIVRPVMAEFPYAWLFFIPFIFVTTFTVLNMFIGIVVDAIASVKDEEQHTVEHDKENHANIIQLRAELDALNKKLDKLLDR
jgi:voltage-gated sodium channel